MAIHHEIGRRIGDLSPFKDRRTPQERLLDNRLAEADHFIETHHEILGSTFDKVELTLFRAAFILPLLPQIPFPFSTDPKADWETPEERLKQRVEWFRNTCHLDPQDKAGNHYIATIITYGREAAYLKNEEPTAVGEYLTGFKKDFSAMRKAVGVSYI